MKSILTAALAASVLSLTTTHTARAEEADDGWDCKVKLRFVHGSPEIGWTVVCDDVVWLCPPEADDDEGVVVQSECVEAVPSKLAEPAVVAAPPVSSPVERPTPPPTFQFPITGLTVPEDLPLTASSCQKMSDIRWNLCDNCAKVATDSNRTFVIYGPDGIPVPIFDRFGNIRLVVGDVDGNGRIDAVEAAGTPATWPHQTVVYVIGTSGQNTPLTLQEVKKDLNRPGYWLLGRLICPRTIYGSLPGSQNHLSCR